MVASAVSLMYVRRVIWWPAHVSKKPAATKLEDVLAASGVSKSQLCHHFAGKDTLVRAVGGPAHPPSDSRRGNR
jgi:TetR/AcrR family transcriptional regulator, transcriptional repressor for nem operon